MAFGFDRTLLGSSKLLSRFISSHIPSVNSALVLLQWKSVVYDLTSGSVLDVDDEDIDGSCTGDILDDAEDDDESCVRYILDDDEDEVDSEVGEEKASDDGNVDDDGFWSSVRCIPAHTTSRKPYRSLSISVGSKVVSLIVGSG
ncbi:hypothetical protein BGZ79_009227 [Entomortierella chlamydospora]|nr:hypothetical protein BGZ79_009227 [Entomortierella chlamydospora]